MKRLTLIVSGKVQKAGYRDRVIELAMSLGLTGFAQNLKDGRVRVIAEGNKKDLEHLVKAASIKNTLIHVEDMEISYSEPTGEFSDFSKLVSGGETDERLDTAADLMKELIESVRGGFKETVGAIKSVKEDTSLMLEKQDDSLRILTNINSDTSEIKSTTKTMEMDIRDARFSLTHLIETKFKEHDADIAQIKTTLAKVQEAIKAT